MEIAEIVCSFAFRSVSGERVDALFRLAMDHTSDHSQNLLRTLEDCNRKAWKALEVALAGETLWNRLDRAETKALREQIRKFLDGMPLPELTGKTEFRTRCLKEIREALGKGVLLGNLVAGGLAEKAGAFAKYSDPQSLLKAEKEALHNLGIAVQTAGFKGLGWLLAQPAHANQSIVVVAAGYFFRREVERNPQLFRGLQVTAIENLSQAQVDGFEGLTASLAESESHLSEALEDAVAALLGKLDAVHADVREAHDDIRTTRQDVHGVWDSVEDVKDSVQGVHESVQEIRGVVEVAKAAATAAQDAAETHAADAARRMDELQARMNQLLEKLDMKNQPVASEHSLSIRNDQERERVRELLGQLRNLPAAERKARPGLVTDMGKLQVAVGDFSDAGESFAAAALMATSDTERAEAHFNTYRAKLEQEDFPGALAELRTAIRFDPVRFAPFPLDKYEPDRILGAGGFGVTFRCRHALTEAYVAVKAIDDIGLDRESGAVLKEAMNLDKLKHRAIIGLRDCGYADAAQRRPFLVMEYFDGPTLKDHVESNGAMPLADVLPIGQTLAEALKAAHDQGILHRDIKPANVMIKRDETSPTGWEVRLIDFGLAMKSEVLKASLSTRRGATLKGTSIAGTLDYAAPEQMGQLPGVKVGPPADIYGFAKTLCYALFKTPRPAMKHYRSVPRNLGQLIDAALMDDPNERPSSFEKVLAVLKRVNPDEALPLAAETDEPAKPQNPWAKVGSGLKEAFGFTPKSGQQQQQQSAPPATKPAPPRPKPPVASPAPSKSTAKPKAVIPVEDDVPVLQRAGAPLPAGTRRQSPRPAPVRHSPPVKTGERTNHAIVAIILGTFGVHKFMQGNTGNGVVRVILGLFFWWIIWIIPLIEGIQYLGMSDEQYDRDYIHRKKDWF